MGVVRDQCVEGGSRQGLESPLPLRLDRYVTHTLEWESRADNGIAAFVKSLGMDLDATGLLGGIRSKRFAAVVDNGKVVNLQVESDAPAITVTAAENILASL